MRNTVLFDRCDIRMGTQLVQVVGRKFSSIPVDDAELVGNRAWGGYNVALDGAKVGSTRDTLLESDDIPAGCGIRNLRNSEKGGGHGKSREKESGKSKELLGEHAESSCGPDEFWERSEAEVENRNEGENWVVGRWTDSVPYL